MITNYFDKYSLIARFAPTLIFLLPFLLLFSLVTTSIIENSIIAKLSNIILIPLVLAFSNFVRFSGKQLEKKLFAAWNGAPTVRFLRHGNDEYNSLLRGKVHAFCAKHLKIKIPSQKSELGNQQAADEIYAACTQNIIKGARDPKKYPLVLKENALYGFNRNLLAMKFSSLLILSVLIIFQIILQYWYKISLPSVFHGYIVTNILLLIFWLIFVKRVIVKSVAEEYAKRLFETVT